MLIRQLSETDASDWRTLRLEATKLHPEAFAASYEEESLKSDANFAEFLRENFVSAAYDGGTIAGCVGFFVPPRLKMRHKGTLFGVYVRQRYRGSGLSDELIASAIDHARQRVLQVHCTVVATNIFALRLYERSGFEIYATEPRSLRVGDTFYDEHLLVRRFDAPEPSATTRGA